MSITNSVGVKPANKTSHLFVFKDENQAKTFYDFASSQRYVRLVQNPLTGDGSCSRNLKRVLVTGVSSLSFNVILCERLENKAVELGGHLMPKMG